MFSSLGRALWWAALCGIEVYLCLAALPLWGALYL